MRFGCHKSFMSIKRLIQLGLMTFALGSVHIADAACTYSEAMMAYKQGNSVRGLALMRIAANDGDARAARYLVKIDDDSVNPEMQRLVVADTQARAAPLLWEKIQNTPE